MATVESKGFQHPRMQQYGYDELETVRDAGSINLALAYVEIPDGANANVPPAVDSTDSLDMVDHCMDFNTFVGTNWATRTNVRAFQYITLVGEIDFDTATLGSDPSGTNEELATVAVTPNTTAGTVEKKTEGTPEVTLALVYALLDVVNGRVLLVSDETTDQELILNDPIEFRTYSSNGSRVG